jgi:uncharacterized protein YjbJ (UPF0337 family)
MDLRIKGNWNQLKGKLKEKYGELTDDDLSYIEGKEDHLIGTLQKKLHKNREQVIEELEELAGTS